MMEIPCAALLPELLQRQRELDLEEADAVGEGVFDGGEAVALAGFGGAADEGAVVVGQPFFHWQALALLEEGEDVALDGLQGELTGAGDGVRESPLRIISRVRTWVERLAPLPLTLCGAAVTRRFCRRASATSMPCWLT